MPLIVGLKRDGEKSLVPDGDFMLMPNDRVAIATTGLSSFNRILNIFGHEATDFPIQSLVLRSSEQIELDSVLLMIGCNAGASVTVIERDLQLANITLRR
jgi:hypothetical protein